jgi:ABC-type multidrug transport system fused ATPase/permease subunit
MQPQTTQEKYLNERWQQQRDYYSRQSARNKRWHQGLLAFTAVGAIVVPILLNIPEIPKWAPTILSGLVAIATAVENVFHFGDNWRNFRQTLEALKRERALFDAGVGLYRNPETAFERFVQTVEDLIATETTRYFPAEEQRLEKIIRS